MKYEKRLNSPSGGSNSPDGRHECVLHKDYGKQGFNVSKWYASTRREAGRGNAGEHVFL